MDDPPLSGLSVARQMGMISYRTAQGYESKFGRQVREEAPTGIQILLRVSGSQVPLQVRPCHLPRSLTRWIHMTLDVDAGERKMLSIVSLFPPWSLVLTLMFCIL